MNKDKKLYIAGIGPGNINLITPEAMKAIESSDVLIGGKRNLELFKNLNKEGITIGRDLEKISLYILENIEQKRITILATGDPGIFSIADFLKRQLKNRDIKMEVIPGISSLQYLCSKIGMNWNDMAILSLHGREEDNLLNVIKKNVKTAVFTGGGTSPAEVCSFLIENGTDNVKVIVGERLSYPDERIVSGTPKEICKMNFGSLSLLIIEHITDSNFVKYAFTEEKITVHSPNYVNNAESEDIESKNIEKWEYITPGIPDHFFIRGDVPMTKEEVRAAALSKMRLSEDSIVFDIGAGTGSIAIECSLICRKGRVYAVERDKEAIELINSNLKKFGVSNAFVVEGNAPLVLESLPYPDRVFIGGSGGNMEEIINWIAATVALMFFIKA